MSEAKVVKSDTYSRIKAGICAGVAGLIFLAGMASMISIDAIIGTLRENLVLVVSSITVIGALGLVLWLAVRLQTIRSVVVAVAALCGSGVMYYLLSVGTYGIYPSITPKAGLLSFFGGIAVALCYAVHYSCDESRKVGFYTALAVSNIAGMLVGMTVNVVGESDRIAEVRNLGKQLLADRTVTDGEFRSFENNGRTYICRLIDGTPSCRATMEF